MFFNGCYIENNRLNECVKTVVSNDHKNYDDNAQVLQVKKYKMYNSHMQFSKQVEQIRLTHGVCTQPR